MQWNIPHLVQCVSWLVVWNVWIMTFHSVGNVIIPTDFNIFQRGRAHPNYKLPWLGHGTLKYFTAELMSLEGLVTHDLNGSHHMSWW